MTGKPFFYRLLFLGLWAWLAILFLGACSTTRHIPEGEQLYIGIGKTKIYNEDHSNQGQRALAAAENILDVAPNNSLFGSARGKIRIPFGLWVYNRYINDSTIVGKKIFDIFASEPLLLSTVNPDLRCTIATGILREHGYFNAQVTDSIETWVERPREARVHYTIDLDKPYIFDSVQYLAPIKINDSLYLQHEKLSPIKRGQQFELGKLIADRVAISDLLRESGFYYYQSEAIYYEADTVREANKVQLRTKIKQGIPEASFIPWTIDKVILSIDGRADQPMQDSLLYDDILIRYNGKPAVRSSVLSKRIGFRPGSRYAQSYEQQTRAALSRLGAFAYTDFRFVPSDTLNHKLSLFINSTLDKPWDASIEGSFKVKSNNFLGPGARVSLGRRNVFGGGETLSAALYGSYEWQNGKNALGKTALFNSYQLGVDLGLNAPSILAPFLTTDPFTFPTSTDITLKASMLNRAMYFRMFSVGASISYLFNRWEHHRHTFSPIKLQFNYLDQRTDRFNEVVKANPALELSLRSQFIPQMSYTYTFDNTFENRGAHHIWMEYSLSEAGNLINALYAIGKPYNETKTLFGVPFAQFVKITGDFHYNYAINRKQTVAARFATGVIYSFGNMKVAPFSEQFYVGGANSIRAYTVRSIGPGSYRPTHNRYAFIDQTGEFKLEANLEWRMQLAGKLYGALFLDAGNIWLLRPDVHRQGGALKEIKSVGDFFDQIALGTGLGVRYDLGFFVIRVDLGFGLHLPYPTSRRGYYNIPRFRDATGFHLAIGYPF